MALAERIASHMHLMFQMGLDFKSHMGYDWL